MTCEKQVGTVADTYRISTDAKFRSSLLAVFLILSPIPSCKRGDESFGCRIRNRIKLRCTGGSKSISIKDTVKPSWEIIELPRWCKATYSVLTVIAIDYPLG